MRAGARGPARPAAAGPRLAARGQPEAGTPSPLPSLRHIQPPCTKHPPPVNTLGELDSRGFGQAASGLRARPLPTHLLSVHTGPGTCCTASSTCGSAHRHVTMDTKGGTDRAPGSGAHPTQVPVRNQAALQSPEHPATRMGVGDGEKTDRGSPRAGWAQREVLGLSHKINPCSFPLPPPRANSSDTERRWTEAAPPSIPAVRGRRAALASFSVALPLREAWRACVHSRWWAVSLGDTRCG